MKPTITFAGRAFSELRDALLSHSPNEAGGLLLCTDGGNSRLLVQEVVLADRSHMSVQGSDRLQFEPSFVARIVKLARDKRLSVILVHTHPLSRWPSFSMVDDAGEAALIPAIFARAPDGPHGALVIGQEGFSARVYDQAMNLVEVDEVREVGARIFVERVESRFDELEDLFDRSVRAFGVQGQTALSALNVAIVGLGGTGSIVTEQLAHLGVASLTLIDDDDVEESNLNRVVGSSAKSVGLPKVDVARELTNAISFGRVDTRAVRANILDREGIEAALASDFIFCCTDSHGSRAALNQIAYQFLLPVIDVGVRIDAVDGMVRAMSGRVQMLAPGLACLQCQRLLDSEEVRRDLMSSEERVRDPYIVGVSEPQPAVISLNGTVSSLGVTMFLSAITGIPAAARRLNYRITEGIVKPASSAPDPNCIICSSSRGVLAKGRSWPLLTRNR